jgi:hypothetical protein
MPGPQSSSSRCVRGVRLLPALLWHQESLSDGEDTKGVALFPPLLHEPGDRLVELLVGLSRKGGMGNGWKIFWMSQTVGDLKLHRLFLLLDSNGLA